MRCPKCGYPNREGAVACDHCRTRLSSPCPRCGFGVDEGASACPRCGQALSEGRAALSASERQLYILGERYQVMQQLSRGRTSSVYRALDRASGRMVAVKRLDLVALVTPAEKRAAVAQFEREASALEALGHPGVVPVLDHFREKESVFAVMGWVTGSTLADIRLEGAMAEPQVRALGLQLAAALAYLHSQTPPIIMRDLKPSHVMVNSAGQAVLLDLGLSRLFKPGQSRGEANRGTSPYEAPEQADGGYAGPQADVYALATLLLVMARGAGGASTELSPSLRRALVQARRKDPDKRTQSMDRFARALDSGEVPALQTPTVSAPTVAAEPVTAEQPEPPAPEKPARKPRPARSATPEITVVTKRLHITRQPGRERAGYRLKLRNNLPEPVEITARSGVAWLTVPGDPFLVAPSAEHSITVVADLAKAPRAGANVAHAVLIVNGGRHWVAAEVTEPAPSLVVETPLLDFGTVGPQGGLASLTLRNDGGGRIPVRVTSAHPWLSISSGDLALEAGQAASLEVRIRGDQAPEAGIFDAALLVDSDLGQAPVAITFSRGKPELRLSPEELRLGAIRHPESAKAEIVLSNTGTAPALVRFSSVHEALTLSHSEVNLTPQYRVRVSACLDTSGLPPGKLQLKPAVRISSAAGSYQLGLEAEVLRPLLAVSDTDFDLGLLSPEDVAGARASLVVSNRGNADLDFEMEAQVPWLVAEPEQGRLVGGASTVIALSLNAKELQAPGLHEGRPAMIVRSQGGSIPLVARLKLIRPMLAVDPPSLDFGVVLSHGVGEQRLVLTNEGTGQLPWTARTDAAWLEITPASGAGEEGSSTPITVRAYGLALPSGTDQARANLMFSGPHNRQSVPVTVALSQPILNVEPVADLADSLDLAPARGQIILFNRGVGDLKATVTTMESNVTLSRPEVLIPSGRSAAVEVAVTPAEDWEPGERAMAAALQVASNGGDAEVDLRFRVSVRPKLEVAPDRLVLRIDSGGAIIVRNVGKATVSGTVKVSDGWLKVTPERLTIRSGRRARLEVSAIAMPEIEDATATVSIIVEDIVETVEVSVTQ